VTNGVNNSTLSKFAYDGFGRRRVRTECFWQNGGWATNVLVRHVHDGMVVLQERDANNVPTATYTRGRDLSGGLQGAGGIGGLLALTLHSSLPTPHFFYHADGNGNITCLINEKQAVVARYVYEPFGNILSVSGPLAEVNLYRFSSKEAHPISGLVYYGFRFYDPNLQRWLNRDPTHEEGGINLYEFALNSPMFWIDRDGRDIWLIELPGFFKHQVIIGDNPDGGYWFTDFGPRGGAAVTGPGVYGWTPQYSPEMLEKGSKVICRVKTSPEVDKALRDRARADDEKKPAPKYWCVGRNCYDYAGGIADEARRRMGLPHYPRVVNERGMPLPRTNPDFPEKPRYPVPRVPKPLPKDRKN